MKYFRYTFRYLDSTADSVTVYIDEENYDAVIPGKYAPPEWTKMSNRKCSTCPLAESGEAFCPVAKSLAFYFDSISPRDSHNNVSVEVFTEQRTYLTDTTVQRALSSLLGLIMAISPCPKTRFLKPMGVFHLPFSTPTETLIRASSLELLRQYMAAGSQPGTVVSIEPLAEHYQALRNVNRSLAKLLNSRNTHDAPVNALVLLDLLAANVPQDIEENMASLAPIFSQESCGHADDHPKKMD